jgi:hypothetical protein
MILKSEGFARQAVSFGFSAALAYNIIKKGTRRGLL